MTAKLDQIFSQGITAYTESLTYVPNAKVPTFSDWSDRLVDMDIGEAAKQIAITFEELRALNIDAMQKFKILETIKPQIDRVLISLEQNYLNNTLIETKRDQHIAELALNAKGIYALLFIDIFKEISHTLETKKFSFLDSGVKKKLAVHEKLSAFIAFRLLSDFLCALFLLYMEAPKNYWSTVYHLYNTVRLKGFATDKIYPDDDEVINTVEQAFKHIILLNILNSHQLRHTEIHDLVACIGYWTQYVQIGTDIDLSCSYIIDYESDTPSQAVSANKAYRKNCFFINTKELIDYISGMIETGQIRGSAVEQRALNTNLKNHIIKVLKTKPVRGKPRLSADGSLEILLGLSSAHFYLAKARHFKETLMLPMEGLQNKFANAGQSATNDSWEPDAITAIKNPFSQQREEEVARIYTAQIVNRSDTGFCLGWPDELFHKILTGQFILLREDKNSPWIGATIRWIKYKNHVVNFGIELVAQHLYPVAVAYDKENRERKVSSYYPAILAKTDEGQLSLILPSAQMFHYNQNLVLRMEGVEIKIFLKDSIIYTQNCVRFNFDLLEQPRMTVLNQFMQQYDNTSQVNDLWESLK